MRLLLLRVCKRNPSDNHWAIGECILFYRGSIIKPKLGYDDSLDAFGVHCVGGIWGALATGLFASKAVNPAGADGFFFGNPKQFLVQLVAVLVTLVYTFIVTLVIYKLVDLFIGVRVDRKRRTYRA